MWRQHLLIHMNFVAISINIVASKELELCDHFMGGSATNRSACFHYHLKQCRGACGGHETPEEYNQRAEEARLRLRQVFDDDFLLFDRGRTHEEEAVVLVQDGAYRGFTFISKEEAHDIPSIINSIKPLRSHPDTARIIQRYVSDKGGRMVDLRTGKRRSLV